MTSKEKSSAKLPPAQAIRYAVLPDRMPPIPVEKMTGAQKQAVAEISAGPRGEVLGPFWPILRSPGYMTPMQKVGEYCRFHCSLDRRITEMGALIAAKAWTQQFEWDVHLPQAIEAGLKPAIVAAIADGRRPTEMAKDEETLYDFIMELLTNKSVSDPTYARALAEYGELGVIDILGCLGYFTALAMIMNVCRTPLLHGPKFVEGRPLPLVPTPVQLELLGD